MDAYITSELDLKTPLIPIPSTFKPCLELCSRGHPCQGEEGEEECCCWEVVFITKSCGHSLQKFCFDEGEKNLQKCNEKVKITLPCSHEFEKLCSDPLNHDSNTFECSVNVERFRKCGHFLAYSPCSQEPDQNDIEPCTEIIKLGNRTCGHTLSLPCHVYENYKDDLEIAQEKFPCKFISSTILACGHEFLKYCSSNKEPQCSSRVKRTLRCNHVVNICSNTDVSSFKCTESINYQRPNCSHFTNIPCPIAQDEDKETFWNYIKDLPTCTEVCTEVLKCGHVCGSPCHNVKNPHTFSNTDFPCVSDCTLRCPRGHLCGARGKCQEHRENKCDPCEEICDIKLKCQQHNAKLKCGEANLDTNKIICEQTCKRTLQCGHIDPNKCHGMESMCIGVCEVPIRKFFEACGHETTVPCHMRNLDRCEFMVPFQGIDNYCGHDVRVPCYMSAKDITPDQFSFICKEICNAELMCGHLCQGTCQQCNHGRFHVRCAICEASVCERVLLCGHLCKRKPNEDCFCEEICETECEHGSCEFPCGFLCSPCTNEVTCELICPHHICEKRICSKACSFEPCTRPCPEILPCSHPCVGFCGDVCPDLCAICDKEKLSEGIFSGDDLTEEMRFIQVPECKHTIEANSLTSWMNTEIEKGEILYKSCPLCRRAIKFFPRYGKMIESNLKEVNAVKEKTGGTFKKHINTLFGVIKRLKNTYYGTLLIYMHFSAVPLHHKLRIALLNSLEVNPLSIRPSPGPFMNPHRLNHFRIVADWISESEKHVNDYLNAINIMTYVSYCNDVDSFLLLRGLPLTNQEVTDINLEMVRTNDIAVLIDRSEHYEDGRIRNIHTNPVHLEAFELALDTVTMKARYTKEFRDAHLAAVTNFEEVTGHTLKISVSESHSIVNAMGAAGRWFKCKNGHVYVVTECGGPTEYGFCNECGETIGGENHRLDDSNALASEMDGASRPLYTTAVDNLEIDYPPPPVIIYRRPVYNMADPR